MSLPLQTDLCLLPARLGCTERGPQRTSGVGKEGLELFLALNSAPPPPEFLSFPLCAQTSAVPTADRQLTPAKF